MLKIHLRDPKVPMTAIHYILGLQDWQLTDDPSHVNCGTCHRMIKRGERKKVEHGSKTE